MLMNVFEFYSYNMCGSTNIKLKGQHVKQYSVIWISHPQAYLTFLCSVANKYDAQTIRWKLRYSNIFRKYSNA